jgi:hypothetical protein
VQVRQFEGRDPLHVAQVPSHGLQVEPSKNSFDAQFGKHLPVMRVKLVAQVLQLEFPAPVHRTVCMFHYLGSTQLDKHQDIGQYEQIFHVYTKYK